MPEMLEVEYYRQLAETVTGRTIAGVDVLDPHCLTAPLTPELLDEALRRRRLRAARRRGKLLLLDTSGPTLGLRFGMTGTLVVDGRPAVDRLLYGPSDPGAKYLRFSLKLSGRRAIELVDPRRFGRVSLDPDEEALGPDVLSVGIRPFRVALAAPRSGGGPPLKARLLDQAKLAGLGNLLVDEILWRAGLDPTRPVGELSDQEIRRLHRTMRSATRQMLRRGGSHLGDMTEQRRLGGTCPRDGAALRQATVGGRTTWWCPEHQH